jgi:tetratricopeptide (TPR) repeat protein
VRRAVVLGLLVASGAACGSRRSPPGAGSGSSAAGSGSPGSGSAAGSGSAGPATAASRLAAGTAIAPAHGAVEPDAAAGPAALPVVPCPVAETGSDTDRLVDRLLDHADQAFDAGHLGEAWTCADRAADLDPESVDAHHLRAAALAALGHEDEAAVAYSMALALDPDDPETLRATADFYVNVKDDKSRDTLWVGLELARRGSARATARRRGNTLLRANLALLEGQALDDLGKSDEALTRIDDALRLAPTLTDAIHERGVALFNLGRFEQARLEFTRVLGADPDDPYAHHFLALTYEWLGRPADAAAHERRAHDLDAADFPAPVVIPVDQFRAQIDQVVASLPADRRAELARVPIEIADLPARADLEAVDPPFPPTILGLFRGLPRGAPPPAKGEDVPPRAIVLYRLNLARAVKTRTELNEQISRTLLHELGHLEGLDEDDLRRRNLD